MKQRYDQNAVKRSHNGDQVFVFLPTPGNPLKTKFHVPYKIVDKVGDTGYVVQTPDRRKPTQLSHINILKPYYDRNSDGSVPVINTQNLSISLDLLKKLK